MTKYLVSGYIGFDNFGDEAIASILAKYLKSLNPEKITWISSNPEKTARLYGVNSVGMLKFFNALKNCDVLISGGGSLLQDITSLKSLLYYIFIITLGLIMGKKVYILAQGFTPFRTKFGEFITKFVLKRCYYVSVRDIKSQELLESWGIKSELIFDPVFGIEIPNIEHKGIGIQLRSFYTVSDKFLEDLAKEISEKFPKEKIKLISLQDSIDLPILKNFQKLLTIKDVKTEIISNLSVENAIEKISKLEFLISMRFHSCLVGAKAGVKVLGINYDKKVEKLANDIGFPYINLNNVNIEQLFNVNTENYILPKTQFPEF